MIQYSIDTPYQVGPVHCYLFEIKGRHILIDTGPPTDEARTFLEKELPKDTLDYVFITHCHADHYGLIDYIATETDAKLVMSKYDIARFQDVESRVAVLSQLFLDLGFSTDHTDRITSAIVHMNSATPVPHDYLILEENKDLLTSLGMSYLHCPGHSQSDIVYLLQGFAVSGDVILKDIFQTPLLDVDYHFSNERFNNYAAFCETIQKLKSIETLQFLPGHRETIGSVDERITSYLRTLIKRSVRLKSKIQNQSVAEIVLHLVKHPDQHPIFTYLKTSEVLFIKDFINSPQQMFSALNKIGLLHQLESEFNLLFE